MNNRSEEVSYFTVVPFILKAYYDSFFVIVYLFNSMKFKNAIGMTFNTLDPIV